jgi:hypothetical protein
MHEINSNSQFVVIFKFPTKERKKIKTSDTVSEGANVSLISQNTQQ